MIPWGVDIPVRRFPVVTVALIAAAVAAAVVGAELWPLVLGGVFLWLFGPSVEDAMGRVRFVVLAVLGGGAAAALDPAAAPAGAVAAVLGGHALLYPRAHVVTLSLVPGWMTVTRVPSLAVLVLWLPLQALAGGLEPAPLAGLGVGLLTVRLLARDPQHDYERAPAY